MKKLYCARTIREIIKHIKFIKVRLVFKCRSINGAKK
jgi:hypothetical protein